MIFYSKINYLCKILSHFQCFKYFIYLKVSKKSLSLFFCFHPNRSSIKNKILIFFLINSINTDTDFFLLSLYFSSHVCHWSLFACLSYPVIGFFSPSIMPVQVEFGQVWTGWQTNFSACSF